MIGETLGGYRVIRQLGQGGMGVVYLAEHAKLGRPVALKVLLPQHSTNPEVLSRFFNEAKATTRINHPGIVSVHDYGTLPNGAAFLVMELLEGESLADRMRRERIPEPLILAIAKQVIVALSAAHAIGIFHRDLKPDNIFLVPSTGARSGLRVKILDFGIAKLTRDSNAHVTRQGALLGTPMYMAPEQCRGDLVDARADIYSLGCILYEMVAGRAPFAHAEGLGNILAAHIYEDPAPIATARPQLGKAIAWALMKEPVDRPQTLEALAAALKPPPPPSSGPEERTVIGAEIASSNTVISSQSQPVMKVPPAARPTWLWPAITVAVAALSFWLGRASVRTPPPITVAAPTNERSVAPSVPSLSSRNEPTPSDVVAHEIHSQPEGAVVVRVGDGKRLGLTPLEISVPRGDGTLAYRVELTGYESATTTVSCAMPSTASVHLKRVVRAKPDETQPSPPAPAPANDPATRKSNGLMDVKQYDDP